MAARDSARPSAGELAAGHAAGHASDCQDSTRATLGVSADHGATGEANRQESKAAAVEDFRKRISLDALHSNDLSEHSKIERSSMEACDIARLSAGEPAAGHASDCKDGKRATLGVSDVHNPNGEDTRQVSKAAVVQDSRNRRILQSPYGNDLSKHSKIERSSMEAPDSARLSAGELAAGQASDCKHGK